MGIHDNLKKQQNKHRPFQDYCANVMWKLFYNNFTQITTDPQDKLLRVGKKWFVNNNNNK